MLIKFSSIFNCYFIAYRQCHMDPQNLIRGMVHPSSFHPLLFSPPLEKKKKKILTKKKKKGFSIGDEAFIRTETKNNRIAGIG